MKNVFNFIWILKSGAYQPELDYGSAEKFWMDGNSCILYNGTWVVDYYSQNVDLITMLGLCQQFMIRSNMG